MTINENVQKMRLQILNLRGGMMTLSTALCGSPAYGTPVGCNLHCSEPGNIMRQLHEDMHDLMVLSAVFSPQPEIWDTFWCFVENESCPERTLSQLGKECISDQDEYIRFYGQINDEMFDKLEKGFSQHESAVLNAEDAWQNGDRLSQILHLAKYLGTQMKEKCDLLLSMLRNCEIGERAALRRSVTA